MTTETATRLPTSTRPPATLSTAAPPRSSSLPTFGKVTGEKIPDRVIAYAVEGFGKTTLGAYAPAPLILMARGETGFVTLRQAGRVPDVDCVELNRWPDVLNLLDSFIAKPSGHKTLVLDAMGGFERLCHEYVCDRDFKGDWGEKGFGAFQKGFDVSVAEWLKLLQRLDQIRQVSKVTIIILSHSKVKQFKNPMGADFDRYIADAHEKTWSVTHKWADAVLFGQFITVTEEDRKSKRVKGIGGTERVFYTQRTDAYDGKNRHGMPERIAIPDEPGLMWRTVEAALAGRPADEATQIDDIQSADGPPAL